jgi:phage shock protein PspC (stress-responsive transcriptional regulator)
LDTISLARDYIAQQLQRHEDVATMTGLRWSLSYVPCWLLRACLVPQFYWSAGGWLVALAFLVTPTEPSTPALLLLRNTLLGAGGAMWLGMILYLVLIRQRRLYLGVAIGLLLLAFQLIPPQDHAKLRWLLLALAGSVLVGLTLYLVHRLCHPPRPEQHPTTYEYLFARYSVAQFRRFVTALDRLAAVCPHEPVRLGVRGDGDVDRAGVAARIRQLQRQYRQELR